MTLKEMEAEIAKQTARAVDAEAKLAASNAELATAKDSIATLNANLATASEKDAAATAAIAAIKADNEKLNKEAKTAHDRAVEILAGVGHQALPIDDQKAAAKESKQDPEKRTAGNGLKGRERFIASIEAKFASK